MLRNLSNKCCAILDWSHYLLICDILLTHSHSLFIVLLISPSGFVAGTNYLLFSSPKAAIHLV